jgi:hypothetical protein
MIGLVNFGEALMPLGFQEMLPISNQPRLAGSVGCRSRLAFQTNLRSFCTQRICSFESKEFRSRNTHNIFLSSQTFCRSILLRDVELRESLLFAFE